MNAAQEFLQRKQRRERQDLSACNALAAAPGNLVAGIAMPANGKLFASCAAAHVANTALVTVKGVTISGGVAAAGTAFVIGRAEKGSVVQKAAGAAGVVTLYIEGAHGKLIKIAEG